MKKSKGCSKTNPVRKLTKKIDQETNPRSEQEKVSEEPKKKLERERMNFNSVI